MTLKTNSSAAAHTLPLALLTLIGWAVARASKRNAEPARFKQLLFQT